MLGGKLHATCLSHQPWSTFLQNWIHRVVPKYTGCLRATQPFIPLVWILRESGWSVSFPSVEWIIITPQTWSSFEPVSNCLKRTEHGVLACPIYLEWFESSWLWTLALVVTMKEVFPETVWRWWEAITGGIHTLRVWGLCGRPTS